MVLSNKNFSIKSVIFVVEKSFERSSLIDFILKQLASRFEQLQEQNIQEPS